MVLLILRMCSNPRRTHRRVGATLYKDSRAWISWRTQMEIKRKVYLGMFTFLLLPVPLISVFLFIPAFRTVYNDMSTVSTTLTCVLLICAVLRSIRFLLRPLARQHSTRPDNHTFASPLRPRIPTRPLVLLSPRLCGHPLCAGHPL